MILTDWWSLKDVRVVSLDLMGMGSVVRCGYSFSLVSTDEFMTHITKMIRVSTIVASTIAGAPG